MANCEKCGTSFTPGAERTEVTSLRVLCPSCEAERRAEKAARAAAANASQAASTAAKAAATPAPAPTASQAGRLQMRKPAVAPQAGAPAAKSPAETPKPTASPAPATARPPSAAAAASAATPTQPRIASSPPKSRTPRTPPSSASAKDLHGAPAKKLLHRPQVGKKSTSQGEDFHPDVRREVEMLKKRESKVMTIAWIICGVLVLAAGAAALTAKTKRDNEAAAAAKYRADLDAFAKRLQEDKQFDLQTEEGCIALLKTTEEQKSLGWEEDPIVGGLIAGLVSKAKANQDTLAEKKVDFERLANIEGTLANPSAQSPDSLRQARRSLETLINKASYGDDFINRVKAKLKVVDRAVLARYREEAKSLAAGGPDKVRAALTAYTTAEDEATRLLDRAMQQKDQETKEFFTGQFKEITEESNAFVTGVFTEEVIEKTPWTDLLSETMKSSWQHYGDAGFRIEGGKLEAVGPAAGGSMNALIAVPDRGGYRDFDMEMEFTLKGTVDLLFRLGKRVDNTVEYYTISTTGQEPLKAGQTYSLRVSYIGNKLKGMLAPSDATVPPEIESGWTKGRKGAFGAQLHEGSELKFTKLRIRELRNAS